MSMSRSYFLLTAAAMTVPIVFVSAGDITAIPSNENHILYENKVQVQPSYMYDSDGAISITSDFPVSSLRYNDHQFLYGATPIFEEEMVVVVTSDCSAEELELGGSRPIVDMVYDDSDGVQSYVSSIHISLNNSLNTHRNITQAEADIDDLSFLDLSVYKADWTYQSYWCLQDQMYDDDDDYNNLFTQVPSPELSKKSANEQTSTINVNKEIPLENHSGSRTSDLSRGMVLTSLLGIMLFSIFEFGSHNKGTSSRYFCLLAIAATIAILMVQGQNATTNTTDNESIAAPPMCKINVEILHDGCRYKPLMVQAPALRVADVVLEDQSSEFNEEDCATFYHANLTFPVVTMELDTAIPVDVDVDVDKIQDTSEGTKLPQLDQDMCYRAIEGRPFVDQSGHQIQATASTSSSSNTRTKNGWCTTDTTNPTADNNNENEPLPNGTTLLNQQQQRTREALGQEWTRRALGEHASVASFAAFTIALMSNNAPPQLIQDSLTAATDEVRHAKVSFEAASMFLGKKIVQPGPLPPSQHKFENNLTALALSTAQEGCIDETLSALLAAMEVDDDPLSVQNSDNEASTEEERRWLKNIMRTIALEEASHSALAWRTIQWICETDSQACEAVRSSVLEPEHLKDAVQKRVQGRPSSWAKIEQVWEQIHSTLIPFVTGHDKDAASVQPESLSAALTDVVEAKIIGGVVGSGPYAVVFSS